MAGTANPEFSSVEFISKTGEPQQIFFIYTDVDGKTQRRIKITHDGTYNEGENSYKANVHIILGYNQASLKLSFTNIKDEKDIIQFYKASYGQTGVSNCENMLKTLILEKYIGLNRPSDDNAKKIYKIIVAQEPELMTPTPLMKGGTRRNKNKKTKKQKRKSNRRKSNRRH
jgi:hypothetical protein